MNILKEAHKTAFLSQNDKEGRVWEVVLIESGKSLNGNLYPDDVLKKAVHLFNNLQACAYRFGEGIQDEFDHLPENVVQIKDKLVGNVVGWFDNARFGSFTKPTGQSGKGVVATFHMMEGAKWLMSNLKDAWESGNKDFLGFSIDADGKARKGIVNGETVNVVEAIDSISSTDIVTYPSAGGRFLRLVASLPRLDAQGKPIETSRRRESVDDQKLKELLAQSGLAQDVQDKIFNELKGKADVTEDSVKTAIEAAKAEVPAETKPEEKPTTEAAKPETPAETKPAEAAKPEDAPAKEEPATEAAKPETTDAGTATEDAPAEDGKVQESEKQKAELEKREAVVRVKEKLVESGLSEKSKTRVLDLVLAKSAFSNEDIDAAISEEREFVASLSESGKPHDIPSGDMNMVEVTREEYDKKVKAFEGFFNNGISVDGIPAVTSLHEAFGRFAQPKKYLSPEDLATCIFESIQLAFSSDERTNMDQYSDRFNESFSSRASTRLKEAIVTTDFTRAFGDAMNVRLQKEYAAPELNTWRLLVSTIGSLRDATNPVYVSRIGGYSTYPTVNQNAPYQEQTDPTEVAETLTPSKKGGLHKLTWEDVLADRVGYIRSIPRKIARAAGRTVNRAVWALIESNATMTGDSIALINASHSNLLSDSALSYHNVMELNQLLEEQTEQDNSEKMGLVGKYLLCGPEKREVASEITSSDKKRELNQATSTAVENNNIVNVVRDLGIQALVSTELGRTATTKYRYYLMADPMDAESIEIDFLGGRDRPDIFVQSPINTPTAGSAFDADALTFKVRHVFGVQLVDYRWITGCLATS